MSHNLSLFGVPTPSARHTDPSTSHDAAASITTDKLREQQTAVLFALKKLGGSGCDADIAAALETLGVVMPDSSARTRRSELVAMGLVRDSGDKVKLPSGRLSIVWEVAA